LSQLDRGLDRRQALKLLATLGTAAAAAPVLSACSGSKASDKPAVDDTPIRIGLLVPQTGVYKTIGDDLTNGFQLFIKLNGGKLGGRPVDLIFADEGETADSGKAAVDKLLKQDHVTALSGVVNSAVMTAIKDTVEAAQVPLVGSNASPTTLQGVKYIWRTSYVNDEPGKALGKFVADRLGDNSVFLMAADYAGGRDEINGFLETFKAGGGRVEGEPLYTPFTPNPTTNFQPYLSQIRNSNAKAVFCFYAGSSAVTFVKQYREANLTQELFAPGFLTEGSVLKSLGDAAKGVYTSMNYSPDLDNAANRRFASQYQKTYNLVPTTFAMASYDAAAVLDKAVSLAGPGLTPQILNAFIGKVGSIDSPRGPWQFNQNRTPLQKWYLRQVKLDGAILSNGVISDLTTLG
jgi:branched-chain amino acid transport system substrate-binding protein